MKVNFSDEVILCGAGASVAAPAALPAVGEFITELEEACLDATDICKDTIYRALNGDNANKKPRFEQVISCILEFDSTLRCLNYLKVEPSGCGIQPNALHCYLAERLYHGATVITTNFDALIEIAFWTMYGKTHDTAQGRLLKIHGSVQEFKNGVLVDADHRKIKADIFSVASGTPITGHDGAMSELLPLIQGKDLLVFGYSFSDAFDVSPALMESAPRSATIIEYQERPDCCDLEEVECFFDLPNFAEIEEAWCKKGIPLCFQRGDPIAMVPKQLRPTTSSHEYSKSLLPNYRKDQLTYLVARLLQTQDLFHLANPIFAQFASNASDNNIRARAAYYHTRTLSEWDGVVAFEQALLESNASEDISLKSLILLLDARAFIGPSSAFRHTYVRFKQALALIEEDENLHALNLGKAYNSIANYLMNRGCPSWAYRFAMASVPLRTRFGDPTDIFNSEYACCLSLGLDGKYDLFSKRLEALKKYAAKINNDSSAICVAIGEGIYHFGIGESEVAAEKFEKARNLYTADGQDHSQVDPELELYLLEARVHYEDWIPSNKKHLVEVARYIHDHSYTYYIPVVEALSKVSDGVYIGDVDRLTLSHLSRIRR